MKITVVLVACFFGAVSEAMMANDCTVPSVCGAVQGWTNISAVFMEKDEKMQMMQKQINELHGYITLLLGCYNGRGGDYRGKVAVSESGKTCQRWDMQTPHKHTRTMKNYPNAGLEENYCRNPDGDAKPWCYTVDADQRFEYCNIPTCLNESL